MNKQEKIDYWVYLAEEDLPTSEILFNNSLLFY